MNVFSFIFPEAWEKFSKQHKALSNGVANLHGKQDETSQPIDEKAKEEKSEVPYTKDSANAMSDEEILLRKEVV